MQIKLQPLPSELSYSWRTRGPNIPLSTVYLFFYLLNYTEPENHRIETDGRTALFCLKAASNRSQLTENIKTYRNTFIEN